MIAIESKTSAASTGVFALKKSSSGLPDKRAPGGKTKWKNQFRGIGRRVTNGGIEKSLRIDEGRNGESLLASWPPSTMNPPRKKAWIPMPDVPPRPLNSCSSLRPRRDRVESCAALSPAKTRAVLLPKPMCCSGTLCSSMVAKAPVRHENRSSASVRSWAAWSSTRWRPLTLFVGLATASTTVGRHATEKPAPPCCRRVTQPISISPTCSLG